MNCKRNIIETKPFEFEDFLNNKPDELEYKTVESNQKDKEIHFPVEIDEICIFLKKTS